MRQSCCPVGVDHSERFDGDRIAEDWADHPVPAILPFTQTVSVFYARIPAGDTPRPRPDDVRHPNIVSQDIAAPTVMISGYPENLDAGVLEVGEGRERAKACSWYDRPPLEPEIEKISVDHKRGRFAGQPAQKTDERSLDLRTSNAQMRIGDYVARAFQHGSS